VRGVPGPTYTDWATRRPCNGKELACPTHASDPSTFESLVIDDESGPESRGLVATLTREPKQKLNGPASNLRKRLGFYAIHPP